MTHHPGAEGRVAGQVVAVEGGQQLLGEMWGLELRPGHGTLGGILKVGG